MSLPVWMLGDAVVSKSEFAKGAEGALKAHASAQVTPPIMDIVPSSFAYEAAKYEEACFVGDTRIHVEAGDLLEIERLVVGDKVLSRCEATGEMVYKRILRIFEHGPVPTLMLLFSYSDKYYEKHGESSNFPLFTTADQLFWVVDKGWTAAGDIEPGDQFLTFDGERAWARALQPDMLCMVYNLEVDDFHTYFVHNSGIWVRNTKQVSKAGRVA